MHRLNAVLSEYQKKYPPLDTEDGATIHEPYQSWQTDRRFLAPLIAEYDKVIAELNQQLVSHQTELESVIARAQQVSEENNRLHLELRKSAESKLSLVTSGIGAESGLGTSTALEALRQQVNMLTREKDSYVELWKQTTEELENTHRSDMEKSRELARCKAELSNAVAVARTAQESLKELESTCQTLDEERQQCFKTAQEQEEELTSMEDQFSRCKIELKTATLKNVELKKALDDITAQLKKRELERARSHDLEQSMDDRMYSIQNANADLEGKLVVAQREVALLKSERTDLEAKISALMSKVTSLEQREFEAICHVKESNQMVENAILEKEQAQIQGQQHANEVARLKQAMATLLEEAGERTRREVCTARDEYNKSISKMAQEIKDLEEESSQRKAHLERALREKKTAEKELERVLQQGPLEQVRTGDSIHDLQTRACAAERARDEAVLKMKSAQATLKRLETSLAEERQQAELVAEEHRKWQRQVQEEGQQLREARMRVAAKCEELQRRVGQVEEERDAMERKLNKECTAQVQHLELKEKEALYRLHSSEQVHQKAIQELRDALTSQQRIGARWREEVKTLTSRFEETVNQMRKEAMQQKQRSDDLAVQWNNCRLQKEELSSQVTKLVAENRSLQAELSDVESRLDAAMGQVSGLLLREKQLQQERRDLSQQLDRFRLERARMSSSGMGVTVTKQYPPTTTPHGSTSRLPLALNGLQSGSRQSLHQAPDAPGTELNRTESQSRSVSRQSQGGGARSSRASQVSDHAPRGEESDASTLSPRDLSVHSHANGEAEGSVLPS